MHIEAEPSKAKSGLMLTCLHGFLVDTTLKKRISLIDFVIYQGFVTAHFVKGGKILISVTAVRNIPLPSSAFSSEAASAVLGPRNKKVCRNILLY